MKTIPRPTRVSRKVTTLFNNLMKSADRNSIGFSYRDYVTGMGTKVRVFGYIISAACDWTLPNVLDCRGVMFELNDKDKPVRIMARPPQKFFNVGEPAVLKYKNEDCLYVADKMDGSLISSFADKGVLDLKSMSSMHTDVAIKAKVWLSTQDEKIIALKSRLLELAQDGYTANMEFVGPGNVNVLNYPSDRLVILNVRHNETGEYVPIQELYKDSALRYFLTMYYAGDTFNDEFVEAAQLEVGKEGYVVYFSNGMVKVKTKWYFEKHEIRDRINSNKKLFKMVFAEETDDLRSMFIENQPALEKIKLFEMAYIGRLESLFTACVDFKNNHKHLERKQYAQLAHTQFRIDHILFDSVMRNYTCESLEELLEYIKGLVQFKWRDIVPEQYRNEEA